MKEKKTHSHSVQIDTGCDDEVGEAKRRDGVEKQLNRLSPKTAVSIPRIHPSYFVLLVWRLKDDD